MNEKTIWNYLIKKVKNPYGVAAIMGNLMAESSLNPMCATGKNKTENYVADADAGRVDFANDGVAFGLVQWCYRTRKQGLLDFAKKRGKSVGDLTTQLDYMLNELDKYGAVKKAVLNAKNVKDASDVIMLKYEKPANTSDAMKSRRAKYGQQYYDKFVEVEDMNKAAPTKPVQGPHKRVFASANVNIRVGNAKTYSKLGVLKKGDSLPWVATSDNGWYAVVYKDRVGWVSGEFSNIQIGEWVTN